MLLSILIKCNFTFYIRMDKIINVCARIVRHDGEEW
jgi:hypothetical protein